MMKPYALAGLVGLAIATALLVSVGGGLHGAGPTAAAPAAARAAAGPPVDPRVVDLCKENLAQVDGVAALGAACRKVLLKFLWQ